MPVLNNNSLPRSLCRLIVNAAQIVASKDLGVQQRPFTGRHIGEISYLKAERLANSRLEAANSGREQRIRCGA